jgi:hypothetical protein
MKTKNNQRKKKKHKCNKAIEDGDALQNKSWNLKIRTKNIATKHFVKHEAQTPKCKVFQQSEMCFNKVRTLEQKILQQSKNTKVKILQ